MFQYFSLLLFLVVTAENASPTGHNITKKQTAHIIDGIPEFAPTAVEILFNNWPV